MFDRMLLEFGKKFTDQWGGTDPQKLIEHWAHAMADYSGSEIKRGLDAMEMRDWPPTLPEFKKMCRPPVNDADAYHEAVAGLQARARGETGVWSHPAIYWAATPLSFDLSAQTYSQIKGRWERALADQMLRGDWPAIPQPMIALPAPGESSLSREGAAKMIKELRAEGVMKTPKSQTDHLIWAKRIMARKKSGDKTLTMIQINFAVEALAQKPMLA